MTQSQRMATEVGKIAYKITRAIGGCSCCGIGIAVDAVGERYSYTPQEWRCGQPDCSVSAKGLDEKQAAAVAEIVATLPTSTETDAMPPAPGPDSRLPAERDDGDSPF